MKFKADYYTRKSHYWNEDRIIVSSTFAIVIDGATPLIKTSKINYANYLVKHIKNNINRVNGDVSTRLEFLARDVADKLDLKSSEASKLPSASLSYFEIKDDIVHIGILGDCEAVVRFKDGSLKRYYDDRLSHFDSAVIKERKTMCLKHGCKMDNVRQYILPHLIENRNKANQDDGYYALVASKDYEYKEIGFDINIKDVEEIYLYSDGYSSIFTTFDIYKDYTDAFKNDIDVKNEIAKIVDVAYKDKHTEKYPRLKTIDDISLLKARFDNIE